MGGQIVFILWRESIEALLVIGILSSWLARENAGPRASRYLWGGIATGLGISVIFALVVLGFATILPGDSRQYLMTVMVFLAAGLIVQMVLWMRAHGRTLRRSLEQELNTAAQQNQWWAVFVLAGLAVAREGSETVVFLYGTIAAAHGVTLVAVLGAVALGFLAAGATYAVLKYGSGLLPWSGFFRVSEVLLLLLGCALFVTGIGDLVSLGYLPYGWSLWDTSWVLDDTGRIGGLVASLTGYRAAPDMVTLGSWVVYWSVVVVTIHLGTRRRMRSQQARH